MVEFPASLSQQTGQRCPVWRNSAGLSVHHRCGPLGSAFLGLPCSGYVSVDGLSLPHFNAPKSLIHS